MSYYVGIEWLAENNADAGILYLIKNLQLDFMAGTSLIHAHAKKFAEIGFF